MRAAAAVAVVLVSACSHTSANPKRTLVRAPAATTAAHTAHLTVSVSGGSAGAVTLNGAIDFAGPKVDVASTPAGQPKSETIVIGDALYSMIPGVGSANGKPWIKISRSAVAQPGGDPALAGLGQTSVDPTSLFAALQGASTVTTVGHDTVRGVATTHYQATVASGQVDVWIDGQGRIRRLAVPSATGSGVTTTTEFYDFGTAVTIVAPPPDEVADLQTLLNPGA